MTLQMVAAGYFMILTLIGFCMCAIDKRKAILHQWRIPEKSFFIVAALGGSIGVFAGMLKFRHKTRHISFMFGIPAIFIIQAFILVQLCILK